VPLNGSTRAHLLPVPLRGIQRRLHPSCRWRRIERRRPAKGGSMGIGSLWDVCLRLCACTLRFLLRRLPAGAGRRRSARCITCRHVIRWRCICAVQCSAAACPLAEGAGWIWQSRGAIHCRQQASMQRHCFVRGQVSASAGGTLRMAAPALQTPRLHWHPILGPRKECGCCWAATVRCHSQPWVSCSSLPFAFDSYKRESQDPRCNQECF
jgi:hypothetical protein